MYFIEFLAKKIFGIKKKENIDAQSFGETDLEIENCEEHVFMPIDSTGEVLSCINCGLVVHKKDLPKGNPF